MQDDRNKGSGGGGGGQAAMSMRGQGADAAGGAGGGEEGVGKTVLATLGRLALVSRAAFRPYVSEV